MARTNDGEVRVCDETDAVRICHVLGISTIDAPQLPPSTRLDRSAAAKALPVVAGCHAKHTKEGTTQGLFV